MYRMRVALETNGLYTTQAGVARYIRGLVHGFDQASVSGFQYEQVAWPVANLGYEQPMRALKTAYRELLWAKFIAPSIVKRGRFDLFHSTMCGMVVPPAGMSEVATHYDLALLRHPERYRSWQIHSGRKRYERLHKAKKILAISRFSADEAVQLLGLNPSRFEVIYLGCDFLDDQSCSQPGQLPFEVPSEFFLFVGSLEPGKNLNLLKETYLLANREHIALPPLVIVGARWQGVGHEGPPPKDWQYVGRQPDDVLRHLYSRAMALVFPSKYEGFGLPVIEAMSKGCPVICSPVASLPEVAGDAALLPELSPLGYLNAMQKLMMEPRLREDLVKKGMQRASEFTWKKCAEKTIAIYQQILGL